MRRAGTSIPLSFTIILGVVVGQTVQDEDLAPLRALIQSRQQLVNVLRVQIQQVAVGMRFTDFRQGSHSVRYHLGEERRRRVLC